MLEALQGFNLKEEWIVAGTADSLVLRVPLAVLQKAAAAVAKATGSRIVTHRCIANACHQGHLPCPCPEECQDEGPGLLLSAFFYVGAWISLAIWAALYLILSGRLA
jgi:hypothetical protein